MESKQSPVCFKMFTFTTAFYRRMTYIAIDICADFCAFR